MTGTSHRTPECLERISLKRVSSRCCFCCVSYKRLKSPPCVCACVCVVNPTTPTLEAPCGVCREQEGKGAALGSLAGVQEQFPFQERKEDTRTHTPEHNNNIYTGSAVCPLRKFLRTEPLPGSGNFPKHTHTHTNKMGHKDSFTHINTQFYTYTTSGKRRTKT